MKRRLNIFMFTPSKIWNYRKDSLWKPLLYLFVLVIIANFVLFYRLTTYEGLSKDNASDINNFFPSSWVEQGFPDCKITDGEMNCNIEETVILTDSHINYTAVFVKEGEETPKVDNDEGMIFYFGKKYLNIKVDSDSSTFGGLNFGTMPIKYTMLPELWQNLDFNDINNADDPKDKFMDYYFDGINEMINSYRVIWVPILLIFIGFGLFFGYLVQVSVLAFIGNIFNKRFNVKFKEFLTIIIYSLTLGLFLDLIFSLIQVEYPIFITYIIAILYSNIALSRNIISRPPGI